MYSKSVRPSPARGETETRRKRRRAGQSSECRGPRRLDRVVSASPISTVTFYPFDRIHLPGSNLSGLIPPIFEGILPRKPLFTRCLLLFTLPFGEGKVSSIWASRARDSLRPLNYSLFVFIATHNRQVRGCRALGGLSGGESEEAETDL